MSLINLPEEIFIIIIRLLDFPTLHNLYYTSKDLQQALCQHGVIKKLELHKNILASSRTFQLDFFKGISGSLVELNLCGINNLIKSTLLPAMKKLKCLKTLDITYTNLSVLDFIDIYQLCPTIKDISVNFVFGKFGLSVVQRRVMDQCNDIFKNFDNVHFVGSIANLLNSPLSLYVLSDCNLNSLKFSVSECNYVFTTSHLPVNMDNVRLHFNHCVIWILNWRERHNHYQDVNVIPFITKIDPEDYEYIIITMLNISNFYVFMSPNFKPFFKEKFNIEAEVIHKLNKPLVGDASLMLWNKSTNNFDDTFFVKLYNKIKNYFPVFCSNTTMLSRQCDWFIVLPKRDVVDPQLVQGFEPHVPKRRMANPTVILNYDSLFEQKKNIMLSIMFHEYLNNAVSLDANCAYLRKITFLNLCGVVRYSADFFKVVFSCCINLVTLNVEATSISPCILPVSRNIHLTKCLKNLRVYDRKIDFATFINSLSKCNSLENIHIIEETYMETCKLADASVLVEKCDSLYYLFIEAPVTENERLKHTRLLNKAISTYKKYHVNVIIQSKGTNDTYRYHYDPYVDVFNLSPMKVV